MKDGELRGILAAALTMGELARGQRSTSSPSAAAVACVMSSLRAPRPGYLLADTDNMALGTLVQAVKGYPGETRSPCQAPIAGGAFAIAPFQAAMLAG